MKVREKRTFSRRPFDSRQALFMLTTALALMPAAGSAETLPDFHMVGENQSGLVVAPDDI